MTKENDIEILKTKVLDQRINLDNMADRVISLEDLVDNLIAQHQTLLRLFERRL
ncbi:MAG: hypothetical protein Unbinned8261contig1001_38 [Prokaryotic dsDNA virus sp.]|nr:MAG: hypothetical protein Unbinned8261contig1001_38 [Prokaryotic dsDNA virus sp.]|tara:strand:- start:2148 stop:2309 length:162 start_codon:yes stop_codon:yes gene_type:complete